MPMIIIPVLLLTFLESTNSLVRFNLQSLRSPVCQADIKHRSPQLDLGYQQQQYSNYSPVYLCNSKKYRICCFSLSSQHREETDDHSQHPPVRSGSSIADGLREGRDERYRTVIGTSKIAPQQQKRGYSSSEDSSIDKTRTPSNRGILDFFMLNAQAIFNEAFIGSSAVSGGNSYEALSNTASGGSSKEHCETGVGRDEARQDVAVLQALRQLRSELRTSERSNGDTDPVTASMAVALVATRIANAATASSSTVSPDSAQLLVEQQQQAPPEELVPASKFVRKLARLHYFAGSSSPVKSPSSSDGFSAMSSGSSSGGKKKTHISEISSSSGSKAAISPAAVTDKKVRGGDNQQRQHTRKKQRKLPLPLMNLDSIGLVGNWQHHKSSNSYVLRPPTVLATATGNQQQQQQVRGIVHFLGGAFVGAAPHLTYRLLLESIAEQGFVVVATPYRLDSLDYLQICDSIITSFDVVAAELKAEFESSSSGPLPIVGIGHSCGALLQCLLSSLFPDTHRAANVLISYNNRPLSHALPAFHDLLVPLSKQVASAMGEGGSSNKRSTAATASLGRGATRATQEAVSFIRRYVNLAMNLYTESPISPSFVSDELVPLLRQGLEIVDQVPPVLQQIIEFSSGEATESRIDGKNKTSQEGSNSTAADSGATTDGGGVSEGVHYFSPSPIDTKEVCRRNYRAPSTLILRFESDKFDESEEIARVLLDANDIMRMRRQRPFERMDVEMRCIAGAHITPLTQNLLVDLSPFSSYLKTSSHIPRYQQLRNRLGRNFLGTIHQVQREINGFLNSSLPVSTATDNLAAVPVVNSRHVSSQTALGSSDKSANRLTSKERNIDKHEVHRAASGSIVSGNSRPRAINQTAEDLFIEEMAAAAIAATSIVDSYAAAENERRRHKAAAKSPHTQQQQQQIKKQPQQQLQLQMQPQRQGLLESALSSEGDDNLRPFASETSNKNALHLAAASPGLMKPVVARSSSSSSSRGSSGRRGSHGNKSASSINSARDGNDRFNDLAKEESKFFKQQRKPQQVTRNPPAPSLPLQQQRRLQSQLSRLSEQSVVRALTSAPASARRIVRSAAAQLSAAGDRAAQQLQAFSKQLLGAIVQLSQQLQLRSRSAAVGGAAGNTRRGSVDWDWEVGSSGSNSSSNSNSDNRLGSVRQIASSSSVFFKSFQQQSAGWWAQLRSRLSGGFSALRTPTFWRRITLTLVQHLIVTLFLFLSFVSK